MEGNLLASFAGILLSLGFGYIPGPQDRYDTLVAQQKALVMAGLLLVGRCWCSVVVLGAIRVRHLTRRGVALAELFVSALIANQATYLIAVKPGQA